MCGDKDIAQGASASQSREDQAGLTPGWVVCWSVHLARAQQNLLVSVPLSQWHMVWGTSHTFACLTSLHPRDRRGKRESAHSLWRATVDRAPPESGLSPALLGSGSGLRKSMETHVYSHHFGPALREKENPGLACGLPAGRAYSCLWAEPAGGRHKSPRQTQQDPHGHAVGWWHCSALPQQGSALPGTAESPGICKNSPGDREGHSALELIESEGEQTWSDFWGFHM